MDPIKNPFSPGAGAPPPELVGRDRILEESRILLARVKAKKPEKSFLLTGLRGVGKTVLLNEIKRLAVAHEYRTIAIEAHENKALGPLLAGHLRSLLFDLDRMAGAGDKVKRGLHSQVPSPHSLTFPSPVERLMEFRIADTFTDSLAKLTGEEQKAVKNSAFDLQMNPANPGIQMHRIDKARAPSSLCGLHAGAGLLARNERRYAIGVS